MNSQQSLRDKVRQLDAKHAHRKRSVSSNVESCYCAPGTKQGRSDTACSGCQNNTRRRSKRK